MQRNFELKLRDMNEEISKQLDIPKETIGKALGHSEWDSTTTDRYIQFDNKKIDEANRKVIDYLNEDL